MRKLLLLITLVTISNTGFAFEYASPKKGEDIIGSIKMASSDGLLTLPEIGIKYGLGFTDMEAANPEFDPWLTPKSDTVILPTQFILPDAPRSGVLINLAEYRLYYFPHNTNTVHTYPIGIGREGWQSPIAITKITGKIPNPTWVPPASVRAEHVAEGDPLPAIVLPGPDNPLGVYKLPLSLPGYLIHGTNKKYGIGLRVSHGCFRMDNDHITELAPLLGVGTQVTIINQPYKFGIKDDTLFMEAHEALKDSSEGKEIVKRQQLIEKLLSKKLEFSEFNIDWSIVRQVLIAADGIPAPISISENKQKLLENI